MNHLEFLQRGQGSQWGLWMRALWRAQLWVFLGFHCSFWHYSPERVPSKSGVSLETFIVLEVIHPLICFFLWENQCEKKEWVSILSRYRLFRLFTFNLLLFFAWTQLLFKLCSFNKGKNSKNLHDLCWLFYLIMWKWNRWCSYHYFLPWTVILIDPALCILLNKYIRLLLWDKWSLHFFNFLNSEFMYLFYMWKDGLCILSLHVTILCLRVTRVSSWCLGTNLVVVRTQIIVVSFGRRIIIGRGDGERRLLAYFFLLFFKM